MTAEDIDIKIISRMTRYDVLKEIIPLYDIGNRTEIINLFIDLRSIVGSIFVDIDGVGMDDFNFDEYKIFMCSTLCNLVGHYRNFFFKFGFNTRVFVFYSGKVSPELRNICNSYKKQFEEDRQKTNIADLINTNIELCNQVFKFVNNVYMIDTNEIDERIFPYIMIKTSEKISKSENIILSNDPYYATYLKYSSFSVLNMKGNKTEYFDGMKKDSCKILFLGKDDEKLDFYNNLITIYQAIRGDKKNNIPGLPKKGPKNAVKFLNKLVDDHVIVNTIYTAEMIRKDFPECEDKEKVFENFRCLDLEFMTNLLVRSKIRFLKIKEQIYYKENNFYAIDDINRINLREHPIKTSHLLKKTFH